MTTVRTMPRGVQGVGMGEQPATDPIKRMRELREENAEIYKRMGEL